MTVLDRLPLRASGKLDRDALPSPRPVSPTPGGAGSVAEMVRPGMGLDPADRPSRSQRRLLRGRRQLVAGRPTGRTGSTETGDRRRAQLLVTNLLNEPTLRVFISTPNQDSACMEQTGSGKPPAPTSSTTVAPRSTSFTRTRSRG